MHCTVCCPMTELASRVAVAVVRVEACGKREANDLKLPDEPLRVQLTEKPGKRYNFLTP